MEVKYVKVPFDLELAKKITNGEVDGKIITRDGKNARILCFDRKGTNYPIVALIEINMGEEDYFSFRINGDYDTIENNSKDLFIKIPEYREFKNGDFIAFGEDKENPSIGILRKMNLKYHDDYVVLNKKGILFDFCGFVYKNLRNATEEEKQKLIDSLKISKDPRAKECLKKLGIEVNTESEFKPFDKVLTRDNFTKIWYADIFSHLDKNGSYICVGNTWDECIPYNEETAHLLGTKNDYIK